MKNKLIVVLVLAAAISSMSLMSADRALIRAQAIEEKQAELDRLSDEVAKTFGSMQSYRQLLPTTINEQDRATLAELINDNEMTYTIKQQELLQRADELAYLRRRDAYLRTLPASIQPIVLEAHDMPVVRAISPFQLPTSLAIATAQIEARRQAALQQLDSEIRQSLAIIEAQRAAVVNYSTQSYEDAAPINDHFDRAANQALDNYEAQKAAIHAQSLQAIRDLEQEAA